MKNFFEKKKKTAQDVSLQITSMADIFMILLVFLLKSYSSSVANIAPAEGLALPVASSKEAVKDALKIEISPSSILVDQRVVLTLDNFRPKSGAVDERGSLPELLRALQNQRSGRKEPSAQSNLLVLADQKTPYSLLKPVLGAAATAGFVDLQLVAVEAE